jgi:hypothetical protein
MLVVAALTAGCANTNNCSRDYHCANGQTYHYCDGTTPAFFETSDGHRYPCESATSCTMANNSVQLWCTTLPPDGGARDLSSSGPVDGSPGG